MKKTKKNFNNNELKILKMISSGYTSIEMANELKYTIGTIDSYVKCLLLKTGTVNRAHLVYECFKQGILK